MSFCVLFVCKCVLYYCHRVATQLQLNISYHIKYTRTIRWKTSGGRNPNNEMTRRALCVQVQHKMVTLSCNHCSNWNTALLSVCITELSVAASNTQNIDCYAIMLSWWTYIGLQVTCPIFLSDFIQILILSTYMLFFCIKVAIWNFTEIRPLASKGQADRLD